MTGTDLIAIVILCTILIAVIVYLMHWLYRHSSKDQSFVRTGSGGEKIVMGGGALVIPIIHDITVVNMNAIPIEIRQQGEQALITKNKMRVDIITEFFVRVAPSEEAVSTAARTLGARTQDSMALKEVIQGRLIDALAAITASLTIEDIHSNRGEFIRRVSELVKDVLSTNGLELEAASLTSLNQADLNFFNPNNHFDAEGLTLIVRETEENRKLRNEIENETRVKIKYRDFEAENRIIEIDRDLEFVRIDQARDIENKKSKQAAEIEAEQSNSQIEISKAKSKAVEEALLVEITRERSIDEEKINSESKIKSLEIERRRDTTLIDIESDTKLEKERLHTRQQIEEERVLREKEIKKAEIEARLHITNFETQSDGEIETVRLEKRQKVENSRITADKSIELAGMKSEREVKVSFEAAQSEAERAVLSKKLEVEKQRLAVEEEVQARDIERQHKIKIAETASFRETEDARLVANREIEELRVSASRYIERFEIEQQTEIEVADKQRLIAVVNKAIDEALARTKQAEALEVLAASEEKIDTARAEEQANRAKRVETIEAESRAERETIRVVKYAEAEKIASEQRAEAQIADSKAAEFRYVVDSTGNQKLNEAENVRSDESRRSALLEGVVKRLPEIIREQVKPMENIESIKIMHVDGLPGLNSPSEFGGSGDANASSSGGGGSVPDQVVSSAMKYRTQVAFVDGLMEELGLPLKNLGAAGGMQFRNFPSSGKSGPEGK